MYAYELCQSRLNSLCFCLTVLFFLYQIGIIIKNTTTIKNACFYCFYCTQCAHCQHKASMYIYIKIACIYTGSSCFNTAHFELWIFLKEICQFVRIAFVYVCILHVCVPHSHNFASFVTIFVFVFKFAIASLMLFENVCNWLLWDYIEWNRKGKKTRKSKWISQPQNCGLRCIVRCGGSQQSVDTQAKKKENKISASEISMKYTNFISHLLDGWLVIMNLFIWKLNQTFFKTNLFNLHLKFNP